MEVRPAILVLKHKSLINSRNRRISSPFLAHGLYSERILVILREERSTLWGFGDVNVPTAQKTTLVDGRGLFPR